MRITTALACLVASVALVAGTVAPATAATQDHTDPTGDATAVNGTPSDAARTAADVVQLQGRHGNGRMVFTVTMNDLQAQGPEGRGYVIVRFVTPTGADYQALLLKNGAEKDSVLFRQNGDGSNAVDCADFAARIFAAREQYVFSIPRSCARNPREVRFGALVAAFDSNSGTFSPRAIAEGGIVENGTAADDARRDGTTGEEIRLGRRTLGNN